MNRRQFIKVGTTGLISVIFSPVVVSCGAAVDGAAGGAVAKTVGGWLADFVKALSVKIIADNVAKWLESLDPNTREEAENTNANMNINNFNMFNTPVYGHNNVVFYGVGNSEDNFNACAPFFAGNGSDNPLIEGPALMGIAIAGTRWANAKSVSAADMLIPIKQYQNNGSQFEESSSDQFRYDTGIGNLGITYNSNWPQAKTGKISLLANHSNGDNLIDEDYDIEWA